MRRWARKLDRAFLFGEPDETLHRRLVYGSARFVACLFILASGTAAVEFATNKHPNMDSGLRWGLFGLMILVFVLSLMMLFAPTKRTKNIP
jgi:hypothetical protein